MKRFFVTFHCSDYDSDEYTITKEIESADPHSVVLPNNNVFCFDITEHEKTNCKGRILTRENSTRYSICAADQVHSSHMIPASELKVADHPIEQ